MKSVRTLTNDLNNLLQNYTGTYGHRRKYAQLKEQLQEAMAREERRYQDPVELGPGLLADRSWMQ